MIDESILNRLRGVAGIDGVSVHPADLMAYSVDMWPRLNVQKLDGVVAANRPDVVVRPRTPTAVAEVLRICRAGGVPAIPYGGGSGVCGGAVPVEGGVTIDLKRMNRVLGIDDLSMTADVEAGMLGTHFEEALNERGYTLGHFPSSIMCSTTGGWAATRSAGQYSSRFGKIEDLIVEMDVALPNGAIVTVNALRGSGTGPDFAQLFIGSEGTFGIITRVRVRLEPMSRVRRFSGFRFMDLTTGLEAMRSIMQHGLRPTMMRLYDPLDTLINSLGHSDDGSPHVPEQPGWVEEGIRQLFGAEMKDLSSVITGPLLRRFLAHPGLFQHAIDRFPLSSMLVMGFEGDDRRTRDELEEARALAMRATGRDLGPKPGEHWYRHRYDVSWKLPKVFAKGAFAETLEISGLWRDVPRIYRDVRLSLVNRVSVMAHFSHAYREGCAIYFTIAGAAGSPKGRLSLYDWTIAKALGNAMAAGGTVSHHHGVGIMKREHTGREFRGGDRLFWAIKAAIDPGCMMNPQKVYPSSVSATRQDESFEDDPFRPDEAPEAQAMSSWEERARSRGEIAPDVPEDIPEILERARASGQKIIVQNGEPIPGVRQKKNGGNVVLSARHLDQIIEMDPISGAVTVQAGMPMVQLENYLLERGYTLGFVPRRLLRLDVGEYLSAADPGAGSPLYGTVRENCIGLSAVFADGTEFTAKPAPRRAGGPDLMHALIGSRGRYGIITAACFRVFPVPNAREAIAFGCDNPDVAVSVVRTILARGARPEWILEVIRAPSARGNSAPVRLVFQLGGARQMVSADLGIIRSAVSPHGMAEEPIRPEQRMAPPSKVVPFVERWLPMGDVMKVARILGRDATRKCPACPEAHVTHFSVQGATVRFLLREEGHVYPVELMDILGVAGHPEPLTTVALALREDLDPAGILNRPVGGD